MREGVEEFLAEPRIAVVGASRTHGFGNTAMRELRADGWEVFPVNAIADVVDKEPCYHSVQQVPRPLNAVLCVVPPAEAVNVVDDCISAGVRQIWFQNGSESEAAIRLAESAGMSVVHHECVLMYACPHGIHGLHGFFARLLGRTGRLSEGSARPKKGS